jgi:glutaredoxin
LEIFFRENTLTRSLLILLLRIRRLMSFQSMTFFKSSKNLSFWAMTGILFKSMFKVAVLFRSRKVNVKQSRYSLCVPGGFSYRLALLYGIFHSCSDHSKMTSVTGFIKNYISANKVMIFSKTYCPYCKRVKDFFQQGKIPFGHLELDTIDNGSEIQNELHKMTGQRTVPSVWINEKFIGGCDDTLRLHKEGKLAPLLVEAGFKDFQLP